MYIDIFETIASGRTDAIGILNNVEWVLGYMYGVKYQHGNSVHILIGTGMGDNSYIITGDSLAIENTTGSNGENGSLYTSTIKMNGSQFNVLNGHSDEEVDDPFSIQEL